MSVPDPTHPYLAAEAIALVELHRATGLLPGELETVSRCLLTGGPSWTAFNLTTGRRMTVAYEPSMGRFNVWCRGNSWSGVRADRLRVAIGDVRGTWGDLYSAEREVTS